MVLRRWTWPSSAHLLPPDSFHRPERNDPRVITRYNTKVLPSLPEEDESCERRSRPFRSDTSFDESLFSPPPHHAPQPPQHSVSGDIKLCLGGRSFNFPSPLEESTISLKRTSATRVVPMHFRRRAHSPDLSISRAASLSSSDDTVGPDPLSRGGDGDHPRL